MKRERSLREIVTNNLGLKLTSLVAAIVLFSIVRGAEDAQRSVFVDVVALLPAPESGKMLVSDLPDRVRITLKGSRSQVNAIRPELLPPVQIELTDTDLRYYYFADDEFDVPAGITITQVAPTSIPLRWADRLERSLPVQARVEGAPPEGLALGAPPRVEPFEVRVVGPREQLEPLRVVRTEPLELTSIGVGAHTRRVPLEPLCEHCRILDEEPIEVRFEVMRDLAERAFPGLSVVIEGGESRQTEPAMVSVSVRGLPSEIDLIDPAQVQAVIDLGGLDAGPALVPVAVRGVPPGVEVTAVEPANVNVVVTVPAEAP
ncbi:MAG: CdaR family protein [Myxococcota bacterium]